MIYNPLLVLILQTLHISGTSSSDVSTNNRFYSIVLNHDQTSKLRSPDNVTSCDIRTIINVDDSIFHVCNELTCEGKSCSSLDYVVSSGSEVILSCKYPYTGGRRNYRCENGVFSGDFKMHSKRLNCLYDPSIYNLIENDPVTNDRRERFFNRMDTTDLIHGYGLVDSYCHWGFIGEQSSRPKYKISLTCRADGVVVTDEQNCIKGLSVLAESTALVECNAPYWGGARYFSCKNGLWEGSNYNLLECGGGFNENEDKSTEQIWFKTSGALTLAGNQVVPYFKSLALKTPAAPLHITSCDIRDTIPIEYLSLDEFTCLEQSCQSLDYVISSGSKVTWCCKTPYSGGCRFLHCENGVLRGINVEDLKNVEDGLTCYYDPSTYMLIGETNKPYYREQNFRLIDSFLWTEKRNCHWAARQFGQLSALQEFNTTLTCREDGIEKGIDEDCGNAFSVPPGSTALVQCNSPFWGKSQFFTCQYGEWIGDTYERLQCNKHATSVVQLSTESSIVLKFQNHDETDVSTITSLQPQNTAENGHACDILDDLDQKYLSTYELTCAEKNCESVNYMLKSGSEGRLCCKKPYTGACNGITCENGVINWKHKGYGCNYDPSSFKWIEDTSDHFRVRFFELKGSLDLEDKTYCHWGYLGEQLIGHTYKFTLTCMKDGVEKNGEEHCTTGYSVPLESRALLECNPPYYGNSMVFTCKNGYWDWNTNELLVCNRNANSVVQLSNESFNSSNMPQHTAENGLSCNILDDIDQENLSAYKLTCAEQNCESVNYLLESGSEGRLCCQKPYTGACNGITCDNGIINWEHVGYGCNFDPSSYKTIEETSLSNDMRVQYYEWMGKLDVDLYATGYCHWGYLGEQLIKHNFKLTLTCWKDDVEKNGEEHCVTGYNVETGSEVLVECNPPYWGEKQSFTCQSGSWIGDTYESLECNINTTSVPTESSNTWHSGKTNASDTGLVQFEDTTENGLSCNLLDSLYPKLLLFNEITCSEQSCESINYTLKSGSKARYCCKKPYSGACNTMTCKHGIADWEHANYGCFYDPSSYKLITDANKSNDLREKYYEFLGALGLAEHSYCYWAQLGDQLNQHEFKLTLTCWRNGVEQESEEHCTSGYSVPPLTEVLVECNPPYVGGTKFFSCINGEWKGADYKDLECFKNTSSGMQRAPEKEVLINQNKVTNTTSENTIFEPESKQELPTDLPFSKKWDDSDSTKSDSQVAPISLDERIKINEDAVKMKAIETTDVLEKELMCPPLSKQTGTSLECLSRIPSPTNPDALVVFQSDCSTPQTVDTEAIYKCDKYFKSTSKHSVSKQYRKCKADGTWTGGHHGFECVLECGKFKDKKAHLRKSDGESRKAQWPWHAALFYQKTRLSSHEYICGGTLITSRAVLTSAKCVVDSSSFKVKNLDGFRIDLGRQHRTLVDEYVQTFKVESIILHPYYTGTNIDSDIAIVILDTPITAGHYVRPICYPQDEGRSIDDVILIPGSVGTTVRFGGNEQSGFSGDLKVAQLNVISSQNCNASHSKSSLRTKSVFCVELPNGSNWDSGDNGDGIYFPVYGSGSSRWFLQGVRSTGNCMSGEQRCDSSTFVFTKVSVHGEWISTTLEDYDALE